MNASTITADMRLLGIDYGAKRIGLALAHAGWTLVTPLKTLEYSKFSDVVAALKRSIADYDIQAVIIGMPLNADGTEGKRCQATRDFVAELKRQGAFKTDMPVVLFDERRTSLAADERGATKQSRDAIAAQIILEDFISHTCLS